MLVCCLICKEIVEQEQTVCHTYKHGYSCLKHTDQERIEGKLAA